MAVVVFALCAATPRTTAQPHKEEHRDWRLTCGEGGEKDPKKPNWTPPTWVYLNCGQYNIGEVLFASWGTPEGSCSGAVGTSDSFHKGDCDSKDSVAKVTARCVGQPKCKIPAGPAGATDGSGGNDFFGAALCTGPFVVCGTCVSRILSSLPSCDCLRVHLIRETQELTHALARRSAWRLWSAAPTVLGVARFYSSCSYAVLSTLVRLRSTLPPTREERVLCLRAYRGGHVVIP